MSGSDFVDIVSYFANLLTQGKNIKVSSYAIYNVNLATTVHTSARFTWSPLPETDTEVVNISQSTGVRYIKYTYTSDYDNTNRSARYFKASGELESGVPTRTVTVTDANTSR